MLSGASMLSYHESAEINANINSSLIGCFCSLGRNLNSQFWNLGWNYCQSRGWQKTQCCYLEATKANKKFQYLRGSSSRRPATVFVCFTQLWLICLTTTNTKPSLAASPPRAPTALLGRNERCFVTLPWSWLQQTVGGGGRLGGRRDADWWEGGGRARGTNEWKYIEKSNGGGREGEEV